MRVQIIGMGALGVLFGSRMVDSYGDVTFVMDKARYRRLNGRPQFVNRKPYRFNMATPEMCEGTADVLLVAVKAPALAEAMELMQPLVGENTVIVSLLNGIDSEERIAERYGFERLVFCVAQGMDAMKAGNELRFTQMGELVIGAKWPSQAENVKKVSELFHDLDVPHTVAGDIEKRMWGKFMLNVGINQTCMAYDCTYKDALAEGEIHDTFIGAMREVLSLAEAKGIPLTESDMRFYIGLVEILDPNGYPSMAQDRKARRISEADTFAGRVIALGESLGVPTPVNRMLYDRIKAIEAAY
ncbi:MAG: ketopantoate reductase family protein [Oscillospiraceae bacterium]|nr:ketopantoate reductase family protein [Oscillospiraceae bacterium]MCD8343522.1 ketopantoate reductase family protein [Oscillospiraceae bacterium]